MINIMSYMNMGAITKEHFAQNDFMFERFISNYDEIWLFGTGEYATAFDKYLSGFNVESTGFVVSDLSKSFTDLEKPVIDITEFKTRYQNRKSRLALLLTVSERYYGEIMPSLDFIRREDGLLTLPEETKLCAAHRFPPMERLTLLFPVAEHCNLACFGCSVTAPLAKEKQLYDFEQFKRDINKISDLLGSKAVANINFTGGDVFMHPQLTEFFRIARELFPTQKITASTNGIEFHKQTDSFWELCGKYGVVFDWTLYPIEYHVSIQEMQEKSLKYGFVLNYFGDSGSTIDKTSWRLPFDMSRTQSIYDFLFCSFHRDNGGRNIQILNNRLFPCYVPRSIEHLRESFGEAPPLRSRDFLKLDEVKNADELQAFLTKRIPLCDYCAIRQRQSMGKWLSSKKEKSEWFITDEENLNAEIHKH